MAIRKFQVHYVIVWFLMLVLAQWRLGYPRTGVDEFLAIAMQVLCFPMNIVVAIALAVVNPMTHGALGPKFFDTPIGMTVGWALFFLGGFVQWFVLLPWVIQKLRRRRELRAIPVSEPPASES
jgi:hypothetical protein